MSSFRVAALVCEGQTDVPILREVLHTLWPDLEDVRVLQPELDDTGRVRHGGRAGWSEVKIWCEQNRNGLDEILHPLVGDPIDVLLLVIDMDIALKAGIADPPQTLGTYESQRLRQVMESWLLCPTRRRIPAEVVFSTPVMAIESWIIAALFPKQKKPEAISDPAGFLVERSRLRKSPKDGSPWKELHRYVGFGHTVGQKLALVRKACSEADRTCNQIEAWRNVCSER